jgi:hypothetical protein
LWVRKHFLSIESLHKNASNNLNFFEEKLQDGTMIDINLFEKFYQFGESPTEGIEVTDSYLSDDVKNAYFIFIKDFCPMVSSTWKKYLCKFCDNRGTATYFNQLTRSDEAYSYWLIQCLYSKAVADFEIIKTHGIKKWNDERKKGKAGKHDSNVKFDEYVKIFKKIDALRNDSKAYSFWMDIFFDKFFDNYKVNSSQQNNDLVVKEVTVKSIEIRESFD